MSLPGHPHEPQLPRPQGPKQLKIYWQILTYGAIPMCNFERESFLIWSHGCQRVLGYSNQPRQSQSQGPQQVIDI